MCHVSTMRGAPDNSSSPGRFDSYADSKVQMELDSPNLSVVEKTSFLAGLQLHAGNHWQSTALDEDLNVLEDECPNKDNAGRIHGKGGTVKRKQTEEATTSRKRAAGSDKKQQRKTQTDEGKATVQMEEMERSNLFQGAHQQQLKSPSQLVNPGRKKRTGYPQKSGLRSLRTQKKQRAKEPGTAKSKKAQTQGDDDTSADPQNPSSTCEEEATRDDLSEISAPKKARMSTLKTESSTDRASPRKNASAVGCSSKRTLNVRQQRGGRPTQQRSELELVLDAFVDYIDHYRESVDSKAVKQSISSFSSIVKEQLEKKIRYSKELKVLRKNNSKVRSLSKTTTYRLLDTKYELMRAKSQIVRLQKEKSRLELRLFDLRTGQAFLHYLSKMNRQYLDYRRKNPEENEMYGASALPALVQEINHLQSTEAQLKDINNQLQKLIEQ